MKTLCLLFALVLAGCGGSTTSQLPPARTSLVAFMGDSITDFWGPTLTKEPGFDIVDLGVSGNTTAQMLARFQAGVIDASPPVGVVVIDGGVNDWFHNTGQPVTIDNVATMAQMAKVAGIKVIVASLMLGDYQACCVVIQPTTADIQAFNQQLITLSTENGYTYADYYDEMLLPDGTEDFSLYNDGVHPNAAGYARMWTVIEPLLEENLT